jgi:ubiquinone/menaquinone biosynthesis C-methylase UbiE
MNENHAKLMPSPEWAAYIQDEVLPRAALGVSLGPDLLELGPGPGAATDWLRHRVRRLVAVEASASAAAELASRFAGTNVEAVNGDAAALEFVDGSFDTVATFTMLHHVPTRALQDKVLAEAFRCCGLGACSSARTVWPATACMASTKVTRTTRSSPRRSSSGCRPSGSARSR